jgi:hypothetical protein
MAIAVTEEQTRQRHPLARGAKSRSAQARVVAVRFHLLRLFPVQRVELSSARQGDWRE